MSLVLLGWLLIVYPETPASTGNDSLVIELPENAGVEDVVNKLVEAKLIRTPRAFAFYLRIRATSGGFRYGRILMHRGMTPRDLVYRITHERGAPARVTIPEGFTRFDIARRLEEYGVCSEDDFLRVSSEPYGEIKSNSMEGYLFPDTYELRRDSRASDVLSRMLTNFEQRTSELFQRYQPPYLSELGWTRHEVVVLASIVEKEAVIPSERAIIAGVFLNRLRSETFLPKHRLQADPTVAYGCLFDGTISSCTEFSGQVTRAMLNDELNLYNTYRHGKLPPGPISNPGLASLEATLNPANHRYFYFVSRGGGRHKFSEDLHQHNEAVRDYRLKSAP